MVASGDLDVFLSENLLREKNEYRQLRHLENISM